MRALGISLLIIPELRVLALTKRHVGSGNEIENYSDFENLVHEIWHSVEGFIGESTGQTILIIFLK